MFLGTFSLTLIIIFNSCFYLFLINPFFLLFYPASVPALILIHPSSVFHPAVTYSYYCLVIQVALILKQRYVLSVEYKHQSEHDQV